MSLMLERPTTDGTAPSGFEALCAALDELDVPDGFKAEVIRGNIVMSPWSKGFYARVMDLVCDRLRDHLPVRHVISAMPFLYVFPSVERAFGPDIHVADARSRETTGTRLDGEALSLVAELSSPSTREDDLTDKVESYGRAGVPVYLLLDMQEQSAIVHWTPTAKGYASHLAVPFGEKLWIPAPFDCALDTSGFEPPVEDKRG
ncbi:Uma2 family endonuclease [Streptomyces physcomitrii]|uniref:Uma2 family endonuclease n=1 Tax=Streptomyces physcomitrii TaxID=2724184 RepID=A0ABX1H2E2_9ACTN|nr:Uma2 family endonuclease [Streptomyces physcomitrii]NKI42536.1 Uma2 family endonuclease [Streptomyces physcomitrii]